MDLDALSPMYDAKTSHYYVNEVARLKNGQFVIPIRWVRFRGKVYADAFSVTINEVSLCVFLTCSLLLLLQKNEATVVDNVTILICTSDLRDNYLDLKHQHNIPKWSGTVLFRSE